MQGVLLKIATLFWLPAALSDKDGQGGKGGARRDSAAIFNSFHHGMPWYTLAHQPTSHGRGGAAPQVSTNPCKKQCSAVHFSAFHCSAVQCSAVQCSAKNAKCRVHGIAKGSTASHNA